ncbi:MAG: hypothetical protein AAFW83_10880 [Pseudomonadota bacterium]
MAKRIDAKSEIKGFKAETVDGVFTAKIRQMHGYSWLPWILRGTILLPILFSIGWVLRHTIPYVLENGGSGFSPAGFLKGVFFVALPTYETFIVFLAGGLLGLILGILFPKKFKLTIDDGSLTFRGKSYALADIGRVRVHRQKGGAFCYVWADYGRREMNLKVWRFFHDASKLQELISSEIEKRTKRDVAINNDDLEMQHRAAAF